MAQGNEKVVGPGAEEERVEAMSSELDSVLSDERPSTRELTTETASRTGESDRLIELAIQKDVDLDKLERLIALRDREEAKHAKREFDEAFAAMRAKFKPIRRTKKGDKAKYAPLDAFQMEYDEIISDYGFSYFWDEEALPDGGLRVIMVVSGHGHEKRNHKDLPAYTPDTGSSSGKPIMNNLQAEGVRASYGRRYTFIAGFGVTVIDEDTDGDYGDIGFTEGVKYSEYVNAIEATTTIEDAHKTSAEYFRELQKSGDNKGANVIARVATRHKEYLKVKGANNANR